MHKVKAKHEHTAPSTEQGKPAPGLGAGAGTLHAETQALGTAPLHHPPLMLNWTPPPVSHILRNTTAQSICNPTL